VVASGCPGCQMHLQVGARRRRLEVEVTHPIVLLAKAYGMNDGTPRRKKRKNRSGGY